MEYKKQNICCCFSSAQYSEFVKTQDILLQGWQTKTNFKIYAVKNKLFRIFAVHIHNAKNSQITNWQYAYEFIKQCIKQLNNVLNSI